MQKKKAAIEQNNEADYFRIKHELPNA